MKAKVNGKKYAKAARKRVAKVTAKSNVVKVVKEEVVKRVMEIAETKMAVYPWTCLQANGLCNYNNASWSTFNILAITPFAGYLTISQGTGQNDRLGNKIRTSRLTYRGVLHANPYNVTYNSSPTPQVVMFVVFKKRDLGGNTLLTSIPSFYQTGTGATAPQGSMFDICAPFNKDLYEIKYKRVFKVGASVNTGGGTAPNWQNMANNDFSRAAVFNMDLTKYIPKTILYNDGSSTPACDTVYACWLPCPSDGTTGSSVNVPLQLTSEVTYEFKDL